LPGSAVYDGIVSDSDRRAAELPNDLAWLRQRVIELEGQGDMPPGGPRGDEASLETVSIDVGEHPPAVGTGLPWLETDLLRLAFEEAPIGIAIADTSFKLIKVNKAFCRLMGYTPQELSRLTFLDVTHPDDAALEAHLAEQLFRGDLPRYKIEKRCVTRSGETVWVELTASLVRDGHGRPAYRVGMTENITERKRAQDALQAGEERFRLVTLATRDAIYDWDLITGRVWRNEAFQELVGPGEPIGADTGWWQARIHPDDRDALLESCQRAFAGRDASWAGEYRFRRANGEYAHMMGRGYIVRDTRGKAIRMIGSLTDVTARRQAEQSLKQSQAKLDALLQNTTDAIWSVDRDYRLVTFNAWFADRSERIFGFRPEPGVVPGDALPEPLASQWIALYDRALRGATFSVEQDFTVDGHVRSFDISLNPLRVEGEIVGVAGVGRDVTLYKQALVKLERQTEALEQQTAMFMSLLDSISDGVLMANERGRFLVFNREAERILGTGSTDAMPEEWSRTYGFYLPDGVTFYPPSDLPLARAIRGEAVDEAEILVRNERLAAPVWLSVSARPLFGPDGAVRGGVAAIRDVTEQKMDQEARDAAQAFAQQMLLAYDRDRQLLAYEMHDGLVQEVTAALMHLEGLRAPSSTAAAPSASAPLTADSLALPLKLLRSALDEGRRLMSGLRPPMIDELGLVPAIGHLVDEERGRGGIEFEWAPPADFVRQEPLVEATLYRIAQEALTNIRRHSRAPKAHVRLAYGESCVRLEVRDWGVGFRPQDVPKRRFGLLGIRERARLFGGQAAVESAPGTGTTVRVELPLIPAAPPPEPREP
jgi:PAS domain S-box-containing protein